MFKERGKCCESQKSISTGAELGLDEHSWQDKVMEKVSEAGGGSELASLGDWKYTARRQGNSNVLA